MTTVATKLIATDPVTYITPATGALTWRPCRVWDLGDGLLAVVTEHRADPGLSVTNAAEKIAAVLRDRFPGRAVRVVEEYPENPDNSRYAEQLVHGPGQVSYRHIDCWELLDQLGAKLATTMPKPGTGSAGALQW